MKKALLGFVLAIIGFVLTSNGQTIYSETFESATRPSLPSGWVNVHTGYGGVGWQTDSGATTLGGSGYIVPAHTKYALVNDATTPANYPASLTSPTFSLSGLSHVYLSFDSWFAAASVGGTGRTEKAWIDFSTNGGSTYSTIDTIYGASGWINHVVALSGATSACKVRFIYSDGRVSSIDTSGILGWGLDNIRVFVASANDIAITAVSPVAGNPATDYAPVGGSITFGGTAYNNGYNTITSFIATYQVSSGATVSNTVSATIAPFASYTFTCTTPYVVTSTGTQSASLYLTLSGDTTYSNDTAFTQLNGVTYRPAKRLFFEEAAATNIGYTPRNIVYMDSLWRLDSNTVSISNVHGNSDPMETNNTLSTHYYNYINGAWNTSFPNQNVDRLFNSLNSDDPQNAITDYSALINRFGFADLGISISHTSSTVTVSSSVKPALNLSGDYRLELVLTERNVHGTTSAYNQANYYSGGSYGAMSCPRYNFVTLANPVPAATMYYDFVARYTVPDLTSSPNGVSGSLPSSMTAGGIYNYTFSSVSVSSTWVGTNLSATVLLIDNNSSSSTYGQVLNCVTKPITIAGPSTLCVGSTGTFTSYVSGGTWSSSAPSIASIVYSSGTVYGVSAGTAIITYSASGVTYTAQITINGAPSVSAISGASTVAVGSAITLTDATSGGLWTSSNTGIATINGTGTVTGVAPGVDTIHYSVTNSCGTTTVVYPLSVTTPSYCTPAFGSPCTTYGMNTSIKHLVGYSGSISDTSACTGASYENLTSLSCSLAQGTTYNTTLYVTGGYYATFSDQIWIDFNDDYTFQSSESVGGSGTFTSSTPVIPLVIPSGANLGTHRMRIVGNYTSGGCCGSTVYPSMNPCPTSSTSFGDARDYTVTIVPLSPTITASPDSLMYGCVGVGSSSTLTTTISAYYLTPTSGTVTVTASSGFQVFSAGSSSYVTSYTVAYTGGAITIGEIAKFTPTATGFFSGTISITGGGASHNIYIEGSGCPPCSGTPTAGTASATVTTGCTAYTSSLSISGTTAATGISYQWQSSPDNATWTNVTGATATAYTTTVTATVYYRCVVTCSYSGLSSSSNVLLLNYGYPSIRAISGATKLCVGSSITLTDSTSGGSWSSSSTAIATVSTSGVVTGISAGIANITYAITNSCGTSTIVKHDTVVASGLTISGITGVSPICVGSYIRLSDSTAGGTWSSTNPGVATVNTSGYVVGVTTGLDTIFYSVPGYCGGSAMAVISVITAPSAGTISGAATVCVGGSATYTSSGTSGGTWSIQHPSLATINSATGVVTGFSVGNDSIYYTVTNSCGTSRTAKMITIITTPSVPAISGASSGCVGGTFTLSDTTSGGVWSSSNNAIASVSSSGSVRGNAAGTATITYAVTNSCGTSIATKVVTIGTSNAGNISGPTTVCVGSAIVLTDTTGGGSGTWTSSNPGIASLAGGTVGGISPGTATISYTVTGSCGSATATYTITVVGAPSAGTISGLDSVCAGGSITLTDPVSGGTWITGNAAVATVVSSTGVVTGIVTGTSVITYSVTGSCGTGTATHPVFVRPSPGAGTITGTTAACVGATTTLSDATPGGTWSSSNNAVASVTATGVVRGNSAGTATIAYTVVNSCGTATATATITITASPTAGTISGPSSVCTGATITLTDAVSGGTWSTSASAVTVDPSTGIVSGISAGTAIITYSVTTSCGTAIATTNITINTGSSASPITGSSSLCPGTSITLADATAGGVWSSSNTARATVSTTGVVTGVAAGAVTISYTVTGVCGSTSATTTIAVNAAPSAGTITGTTTLCTGATTTLTDAVSGGTWSSSNTAVASVTSGGIVRGNSAGTATISYSITTSCGTGSATATVTVTNTATAGSITGATTVCTGANTTLTDAISGGTWSSSNTSVASVNSATGVVGGITAGTAVISYTVTNSCGTATTTQAITVNPSPTAGTISGATTVCTGASSTLTDAVSGGTWSSSNASVASVNAATGVVTGAATGTATISYSVTNSCGTASATATITVNGAPTAGSISGSTIVCPGSSSTLVDGVSGGVWSSSNTSIATISTTGVVTGVAIGSANITYTVTTSCGTARATTSVTVSGTPSAGTITGTTTLCTGGTTTLADVVAGGVWSSSNTTVATVNSAGVVTGVSAGTATISYRVTNSCGSATATTTVTVTTGTTVAAITGTRIVCVGATTSLSDATAGGSWSSSNPTVASVNTSGVVRGNAAGSAMITYSVTGSCGAGWDTATIFVTATPAPAAIAGASTVCVGTTTALTDATAGGVWSSSAPTIATVSTTGTVTGIAVGSVNISYTVTGTCGSSSVTKAMTVNTSASAGTISGASNACTGTSTTYTSTVTGGTWSSSNVTVASVSSSTGIVTALTAGTATITYSVTSSCGTATATKVITVGTAPTIAAIAGTTTICTGTSTTLSDATAGGVWSSSNTAVASVNSATGVVNGISAGAAIISYTITASCGPISRTATMIVNGSTIVGGINGATTICAGTSTTLTDTSASGTWSSSNPAVATVSTTGVVIGVSAGTATISYSITGSCGTATATAVVTVSPGATAGSISGTTSVCISNTTTLTSTVAGGTWSSSNNAIASVTAAGVVRGNAAGTATITYTVSNSCGTSVATTAITVSSGATAGTISGASSVCAGANSTLTSTVSGGTWTSSNNTLAVVGATTGVVTGVSSGSVTITYSVTSGSCGSAIATHAMTVNPAATAGTISGTSIICTGTTSTMTTSGTGGIWSSSNPAVASVTTSGIVRGNSAGTATISYTVATACGTSVATANVTVVTSSSTGTLSGASTVCIGNAIAITSTVAGGAWSSSNAAVASVNASGAVTGVSAGTATITYTLASTCGTATATKTITVSSGASAGTISGATAICVGSSVTLTDAASGGVWSVSNASIATVNTAGVVYGLSAGTATISYTVTNSCGSVTATISETVSTSASAGTISGTTTICPASPSTLTSTVSGGTWATANASIASVNSGGTVTGISGGITTITYTVTNGCGTASATASVNIAVAGNITGASSVCVGGTTIFTDAATGGTWSSNNNTIATVSTTGVVGGVAAGTTTISYIVVSSCGTTIKTAAITVGAAVSAGTISGASTLVRGTSITLTDGVAGGTWTSSSLATATVGAATGVVTGVAAGTVTITYAVTGSCGTAFATKTLSVTLTKDGSSEPLPATTQIDVNIYPNPTSAMVHIVAGVKVNVVVLTSTGRAIIDQKEATDIDLSAFADGMYMIMVYDAVDNSLLKASKLMKME